MRLASLLAASAAIAFAAPAAARDLTIAVLSQPHELTGIVQNALAGPFADSLGHPVGVVGYPGGLDTIRNQAGLGADAAWDVVDVREADLQPGCDQKLFEKLDWSAIGGRDRILGQGRVGLRHRRVPARHGADLGPRQVPGDAELVGFLGHREIPRQARAVPRCARQSGNRAAGGRCRAR